MIDLKNTDALSLFKTVKTESIDLVLTDPPYIISKESGMQAARDLRATGFKHKNLQLAVQTDFGEWDKTFTMEDLKSIVIEMYRSLRKGGSAIIFFDLWKITDLKKILEDAGFKQIRFIEWVKTNPVPINSKTNYLTNAREIALMGVKTGKPTFNSEYDSAVYENVLDDDLGLYKFGIHQGKDGDRIHPTQKSLKLFEVLVQKHSNPNDTVLDCFSGSATTAIAALNTGRNFVGCELDENYFNLSVNRIANYQIIIDNVGIEKNIIEYVPKVSKKKPTQVKAEKPMKVKVEKAPKEPKVKIAKEPKSAKAEKGDGKGGWGVHPKHYGTNKILKSFYNGANWTAKHDDLLADVNASLIEKGKKSLFDEPRAFGSATGLRGGDKYWTKEQA